VGVAKQSSLVKKVSGFSAGVLHEHMLMTAKATKMNAFRIAKMQLIKYHCFEWGILK
jgi:hypothetical protein